MKASRTYALAAVAVLAGAGLFVGSWPLAVFAVVVAALGGWYSVAFGLGVLLDVLWGAPTGAWQVVQFPCALLALAACAAHAWGGRYFLDKNLPYRV